MRFTMVLFCLSMAAAVYGQSIVTPVFVHRDGEASVSGYAGSQEDILVDGGVPQVTGWLTFQAEGIDLSRVSSGTLALYVKRLENPGTLGVYPLTAQVTAPENNVPVGTLPVGATAIATVSLGTADIERVVHLDVTSALTGGDFHGVALAIR